MCLWILLDGIEDFVHRIAKPLLKLLQRWRLGGDEGEEGPEFLQLKKRHRPTFTNE